MKCDELKRIESDSADIVLSCFQDVYEADSVDAAIAELKAELAEKDKDIAYWREEYDKETQLTDALKDEIESLKASHYAESVDAGMRERRLQRALWIARAKIAKAMKAVENLNNYLSLHKNSKWFGIYATRIDTWYYKWDDVERKCRKKAEEYKEADQ